MSLLSSTLIWCALQTTILALFTLALGSRPWRIGGSAAPLFGLLGVFLISVLSFLPIPWSWTATSNQRPSTAASSASLSPTIDAASQVDRLDPSAVVSAPGTDRFEEGTIFIQGLFEALRESTEPQIATQSPNISASIVLGIFGGGLAVGTLRLLIGLIATRKLIQNGSLIREKQLDDAVAALSAKLGLKVAVRIYQTDKLSTAATLGIWRPRILLPTHWREWNDAELNAVLAHELAHIVHGDFAAVIVSQLSVVFHFYHPLVHWLSSRLRLEQELAADSVAAQLAGGQVRYLKVLAKLALEHEDRFVGWPARAFLPTRHAFLRRLEMLRSVTSTTRGRLSVGRWIALVAILMASLALVGLKPPPNRAVAQDSNNTIAAKRSTNLASYDTRYFSDNGGVVFAVRPAELFASESLSGMAEQIQDIPYVAGIIGPLGLELKDIEQLLVGFDRPTGLPTSAYIHSSKPIAALRLTGGTQTKLAGAEIWVSSSGDLCVWKPDDSSIVLNSKRNIERWIQGREVGHKLTKTDVWTKLIVHPLMVIGEGSVLRNEMRDLPLGNGPAWMVTPLLAPILDEAEFLGAAVSTDKDWRLIAMAKSLDAKGTAIIQETSQAGVVLLKNSLREIERTLKSQPETPVLPSNSKSAMEVLLSVAVQLAEGATFQTEDSTVSMKTSIKSEEIPVTSIAQVFMKTRIATERAQSANNLRQIGLAFHNFESAYRQFPHPTKSPDPSQKHPVSWRVMILPFIEQNELYQAYHFDEPWDGPNNIKLLSKMPAIYRHPKSKPDSTETNYAVFAGDETIFQPAKAAMLASITDGTSNTILAVETTKGIPWTKPEDLDYTSGKPLPLIGGFYEEGTNVAFADGSVRFLSKTLQETLLRSLITAQGGEGINDF